ncbi:hypothetical protein RSOLAG1IB_06605 [Rhizoctonia solani AG-1 IB]|uniref:N-acetyltransferase domain-containing protein n=1 Tax=Thanatephorus cucumeris (strain AG1-IB / isolate 7/3/14) TaxID=1108050 RepID=A0A0B7FA65_THACB|nr:hypothetical protein RSOLAG1IB_06605 [Rhizoctonia solani AG-1 IB]
MYSHMAKPIGLDIELLEAQGGQVSREGFSTLFSQLQKSHLLDHLTPLPTNAGEFDVLYIILSKGRVYEPFEGNSYGHIFKDGCTYWLAGFAYLLVPPNHSHEDAIPPRTDNSPGDTADITIALLPAAQNKGFGRFVVQRLLSYAFDTLHIHRVTASVVCPVQPSYSMRKKKQVAFNTKQLCWIFEKFGFNFEGISRGAITSNGVFEGNRLVWYDVHRMSILATDYFGGRSIVLSNICSYGGALPLGVVQHSPWEKVIQRQEEEKHDVELWSKRPKDVSADDACDENGGTSDDETILDGDDSSEKDWDMANDFDN